MKLSKKASRVISRLLALVIYGLAIAQIVFLTMKLTGAVDWSWRIILMPTFCCVGLPLAIVVIAVIVLAPKVIIEDRRRRKRVEAEAKKHGMEREPGESIGDLKKRIIRRNMMTGNYSRKEVKDMILEAFPTVGSCQILISNHTKEIVLIPRPASTEWQAAQFTNAELREIAEFAAEHIPFEYTVAARNADVKGGEINGNTET